jgi:CRISPR-associated protein Cmr2
LAGFARHAREIVNRHGFTVYSGGDDVLGFVPPATSLVVAEQLRDAFAAAVGGIRGISQSPSLSVGLGIGHIFDGMAHLLELGRQAERVAKGNGEAEPRDALGIIVDHRSGGTTAFRGRWQTRPTDRIRGLARLIAGGRLPMGKIHEVKRMLQRLPVPGELDSRALAGFAKVLDGEVRRILGRAGGDSSAEATRGPRLDPAAVLLDIPPPVGAGEYARCHAAVADWVNACLVAREFRGTAAAEEESDG